MADEGDAAGTKRTFLDDYDIGKKLGSGAFAEVFLCSAKPHGMKHAVKIIKNGEATVELEINILKGLKHDNIVRLIDVLQEGPTIYIVQELISGGEMFDYIIDKGTYSEADAAKAFGEILEGLKYLHSKRILHRDLKPENILLSEKSENATIKIADFGLAKIIPEHGMTSTTCGTPGYVAPEVLRQKKYGLSVDIWAAGVILYIMVSGYEPFYDDNETQMYKNIMSAKFTFPPDLFGDVSPEITDFICSVLVVHPEKRPTAEQCLTHPWLRGHKKTMKSKRLFMARENIRKLMAKKKFKGALIAVRMGGRVAANRMFQAPSPMATEEDKTADAAAADKPSEPEEPQVVVDLDKLAREMNTNFPTTPETEKKIGVAADGSAETEQQQGEDEGDKTGTGPAQPLPHDDATAAVAVAAIVKDTETTTKPSVAEVEQEQEQERVEAAALPGAVATESQAAAPDR